MARRARYGDEVSDDIPPILRDPAPWHERIAQVSQQADQDAAQRIARRRERALSEGLVAAALAVAAYAEMHRIAPERRELTMASGEFSVAREVARRCTRVTLTAALVTVHDGVTPSVEVHVDEARVLRVRAGAPRYGWLQQRSAACEVLGYVPGAWEEAFVMDAERCATAILATGVAQSRDRHAGAWGDLWEGVVPEIRTSDVPDAPSAPLADALFDS